MQGRLRRRRRRTLGAVLLGRDHLLDRLGRVHEARGLVDKLAAGDEQCEWRERVSITGARGAAGRGWAQDAPGHVLLALLADLDVDEDERVQAHLPVLLDAVVERARPPRLGEEDERDRLAKVVQLQAGRAARVEDRRVVDHLRGHLERPRAQEEVRVRRGAVSQGGSAG